MTYQELSQDDFEEIISWFDDQEIQKRLRGFYPVKPQLQAILDDAHRQAWVVVEDLESFAFVEIEKEQSNIGNFLIIMNPKYRNQRKSQSITQQIEPILKAQGIQYIHAYIEQDYLISKKCFQNVGYQLQDKDEEFELWVKDISNI